MSDGLPRRLRRHVQADVPEAGHHAVRDRRRREGAQAPSACTAATSSTGTRTAWRSASAASCAPASARPAASTCAAPTTTADDPVSPGERYGFVYEINYLRCIHCDLCVEACPTEAITETKLFEFSFTNRQDAIYTKAELLVGDDGRPQHLPWEDWRPGEDQHTSAWMRATVARRRRRLRGHASAGPASSATACAPPEKGQAVSRTADARRPTTTTTTGTTATDHGASTVESVIFCVCALIVLGGAFGVIWSRNPVHSALSLVATLFGVAVLFLNQNAQLLAAVQVIVYTGAIVVLILFVLMLLGVDSDEDIDAEPLVGQRTLAAIAAVALFVHRVRRVRHRRHRGRHRHPELRQRPDRHHAARPTSPAASRSIPSWPPSTTARTSTRSAGCSSPTTPSPSRSPRRCSPSPWSAPSCWPGARRTSSRSRSPRTSTTRTSTTIETERTSR